MQAIRFPHQSFNTVAVYRFLKFPSAYSKTGLQKNIRGGAYQIIDTEGKNRKCFAFFEQLFDKLAAFKSFLFAKRKIGFDNVFPVNLHKQN